MDPFYGYGIDDFYDANVDDPTVVLTFLVPAAALFESLIIIGLAPPSRIREAFV
jgi:hypothetical protein